VYDVIYDVIKLNNGWWYIYIYWAQILLKKKTETMHVMNLLAFNKSFYRK